MPAAFISIGNGDHVDLVFIQNGMVLPWLKERGLENNTQVMQRFGYLLLFSDLGAGTDLFRRS